MLVILTQQEWQVFDTASFRLLRSLAVALHGHEWKEASNEKIVAKLGVLHPRQLLRIERLRQFQKICQFADADFWAILDGESNWLNNMLYSDLIWLKENRLCPDWLCIPEVSQIQSLVTVLADEGPSGRRTSNRSERHVVTICSETSRST